MASNRHLRQKEIFEKKVEIARALIESGGWSLEGKAQEVVVAKDLQAYRSVEEYPKDLPANRLKIDMDKEVIFVPINGSHVPFHVSAIKQITFSDPDLRINFFSAGSALAKDVAPNMRALITKYEALGYAFIKEVTYRASDTRNLSNVLAQYQELRKRIRLRDQKAEQEKGLVEQAKLIRIKDQRVPRLQEVTMRPSFSGRKSIGTVEAHQNGLRFTSSKSETVDIMYNNIKHAVYQPCDKTTMVLVHFHLKDPIMIGKKKQKDVQFYTEAIEASLNLENARRYGFDPDEIEEEQREREMKRRLNLAFKEFCSKLEKLAAHYDHVLQFDAPYKKSGFFGNPGRDMVFLQPTANCLVNLTEWPPLVITLDDIDHVHCERVTFATKNFDVTFIWKDWMQPPKTITAVDIKYMDIILDWINEMELTYTRGIRPVNWTEIMAYAREMREDGVFYASVFDDGGKKPVGWNFLSTENDEDEEEEEEEEESDYSEEGSDDSDDDDDDDDEDDSDLEDEDSDEDDYEEDDDDLEEKGMVRCPGYPICLYDVECVLLSIIALLVIVLRDAYSPSLFFSVSTCRSIMTVLG